MHVSLVASVARMKPVLSKIGNRASKAESGSETELLHAGYIDATLFIQPTLKQAHAFCRPLGDALFCFFAQKLINEPSGFAVGVFCLPTQVRHSVSK